MKNKNISKSQDWYALVNDLQSRQRKKPSEIALAHKLGRYYYHLTTHRYAEEKIESTIDHWRQVIANWALVLEDDTYWQTWLEKQAQTYDVPIASKNAQAARDRLWQLLLADLTHFDDQASACLPYHDSLAVHLQRESDALRLLKAYLLSSPPLEGAAPLTGGPLLLRYLDQEEAFGHFIATQVQYYTPGDSLMRMVDTLQENSQESGSATDTGKTLPLADKLGLLMLYYSQLGGALVYVQKGQSTSAVSYLRQMQCEICSPLSQRATTEQGKQAIEVCHADCPNFTRNNPAYSQLPDAWDRLWGDTIKLAIKVCILGARDLLRQDAPDYNEIEALWNNALNLAWHEKLKDQVKQEIIDSVMLQIATLEKREQWEQAANALQVLSAIPVIQSDQFAAQQAKMLNRYAVSKAQEKEWAEALSPLRSAYHLTPQAKTIRENLLFVTEQHADQLAAAGKYEAARGNLTEIESMLTKTSPDQSLSEELERVQFKRDFVYLDFWHHSPLFNRAFDEAKRLKQHYLGVAHLFLSLTQVEGGLTQETLYRLGISPQHFQIELRQYIGMGDNKAYWEITHFTPRLRGVLLRAIELAQARGTTALDEPDFLYAIIQDAESAPMQTLTALGLPLQHLTAHPAQTSGKDKLVEPRRLPPPPGTTALICQSGPEDGKVTYCKRDTIAIGRARENDVVLNYDRLVSRRHASLTLSDVGYMLKDLNSSMGTYLEWNIPIQVPTPITAETPFKIGQTWLRIWQS